MSKESTRRGLVIISALISFTDWLDAQNYMVLPEEDRGRVVKEFLDAHQEGDNYFMQAEQIAEVLGVPFQREV